MANSPSIARIIADDPARPWLVRRTRRSLLAAGFDHVLLPSDDLPPASPCLLIRAGRVLEAPDAWSPPPSRGDIPLIAVGLPPDGCAGSDWTEFHNSHGGDYPHDLPPPLCEWHNSAAHARARLFGQPAPSPARAVHWPPLDLTTTTDAPAVWQVVTSLQHGGAERLARELALDLPRQGLSSRLVVLGKPHRTPMPPPPGTLDLSHLPRSSRASELARLAVRHGVDCLHLHLLDTTETRTLAGSGIPLAATVHNARPGWPRDWESLTRGDLALLLPCSLAAEKELRKHLPDIPCRTVWNGIRTEDFPERPIPDSTRGFTVACIANPRPQKRLERLPAILNAAARELSRLGHPHSVIHLVLASETAGTLPDAVASRAAFDREATRHGLPGSLTTTEGSTPVRNVLAASHALVSCSDFEGLSLAHLEALASGLPVVALATGGTGELAHAAPAMRILPADADDEALGHALAAVLLHPPASARPVIHRDFSLTNTANRVARHLHQLVRRPESPATTVWFVSNNLSTGGAQSSLRRLARALHDSGAGVRLALLQEHADHPGHGRLDLLDAGIPVFVPPPAGTLPPQQAVDLILAEMASDPPHTVVFWNAITSHKLLLAEALPHSGLFDISPGEMFFDSLHRTLLHPPPGLACRSASSYGMWFTGIVVKYHAEAATAAALGAPVHVIPNGVPCPESPPPRPLRTPGSPLVFATAARISPQKHLGDLLDALRTALPGLPPCILRIAGSPEHGSEHHAQDLRRMADGLPVEWCGEIHDMSPFHDDTDIFVMISRPAGCPNASLEALARGLPVIATDFGGASEQVIDGRTGLLVADRDTDALAAAMIRLARDPELRSRLGRQAHHHIRNNFSLTRMEDGYRSLFLPQNPPISD